MAVKCLPAFLFCSAILASYLLDEKLNIHGKMGVVLACLGSTVVVLNAPKEASVDTLAEIGHNLINPGKHADVRSWMRPSATNPISSLPPVFLTFSAVVVALTVYLICYVAPRHGTRNILVYISICSLLGAFTVTSAKGLSIALRHTFTGNNQLLHPLTWFFLITLATCITFQMNYLNKALDIYNTAIVTPIYYVMFNILASTASAILFKEFDISLSNIVVIVCGFLTIVIAVFLLQAFKDIKLTLTDVLNSTEIYRRKPDHPNTAAAAASCQSQLDSNLREEQTAGPSTSPIWTTQPLVRQTAPVLHLQTPTRTVNSF